VVLIDFHFDGQVKQKREKNGELEENMVEKGPKNAFSPTLSKCKGNLQNPLLQWVLDMVKKLYTCSS
jgi:hypothetical protein